MILNVEQNSPEWKAARCGSLGASQLADAIAKTKTGWGASRANLMAELVVERLTDTPTEGYQSPAMLWGKEHEAEARAAYEFKTDATVEIIGIATHPTIKGSHASPDGLVGDDGLVEIKCPNSATHIDTLLGASIAGKYLTQMQWQMACTGRAWCDFISYDPRMPEAMRLFVKRVPRDDVMIATLENDVRDFIAELAGKVDALRKQYAAPIPTVMAG
jgi:putative phage-type endonuclease